VTIDQATAEFVFEDADETIGKLVERRVTLASLPAELIKAAVRLEEGAASNLDHYDPVGNPQGCFHDRDTQEVFYRVMGTSWSSASYDRAALVRNAAEKLFNR
jgi:hypothetical protein